MKQYTVGIGIAPTFVVGNISEDIKCGYIPLILKSKPSRQVGHLNLPGGKVEEFETPIECISREWKEETGVEIPANEWIYIGNMIRPNDFIVHCYLSVDDRHHQCKTQPGEDQIVMIHTNDFLNGHYIEDKNGVTISYDKVMPNVDLLFRFVRSPDFLAFPGLTLSLKFPPKNTNEKDYGDVQSN